uniref:Si:dkey-19b23.7 n=1 Tax=Dicentrarchus labrax TaxID=13489 RepID=A0A8P4G2K2_DICLA
MGLLGIEREQRRKLQHFLSDLALLGSLQGFKYFQPWLRGKEELLLTVVNEDLVSFFLNLHSVPRQEVNCTLFLLAGYVKYGTALRLDTLQSRAPDFYTLLSQFCVFLSGVRIWDIVSELVCLCTVPSPSNPFALDMRYIKSLPLTDCFLVTGALLNFLEVSVNCFFRSPLLSVVEEVKPLRRLHVKSLLELQRHRESSGVTSSQQDSSGEE